MWKTACTGHELSHLLPPFLYCSHSVEHTLSCWGKFVQTEETPILFFFMELQSHAGLVLSRIQTISISMPVITFPRLSESVLLVLRKKLQLIYAFD